MPFGSHRRNWLALLVVTEWAGAQTPAMPPARPLGPIVARSAPLRSAAQIRALSDGRVIVHDRADRRVLLFDSTLASPRVLLDSAAGRAISYGAVGGSLLTYPGDTTVFYDAASLALLVFDPAGAIVRTMAIPATSVAPPPRGGVGGPPPPTAVAVGRGRGGINPVSTGYGIATFDGRGRLVYGVLKPRRIGLTATATAGAPVSIEDSSFVLAIDVQTRAIDTVARLYRGSTTVIGSMMILPEYFPVVDEWAVLADGSIVVVRGRDYHLEVGRAGEPLRALPRTPFPWARLTDAQKRALADSLDKVNAEAFGEEKKSFSAESLSVAQMIARGVAGSAEEMRYFIEARPQRAPLVMPDELPDYLPVFARAAIRPDADNNVWVRLRPEQSGSVKGVTYDVLSARGERVDRIVIPDGLTIVGFGRGGVVFLVQPDAGTVRLLRARVR